jgi:hypothetical protein
MNLFQKAGRLGSCLIKIAGQLAPPGTKDKIHAGTTRFEIRNLKF